MGRSRSGMLPKVAESCDRWSPTRIVCLPVHGAVAWLPAVAKINVSVCMICVHPRATSRI